MKKIFYLILMSPTLFASQATAQTVQVLDSVKTTPIEYATIIVLNATKDTILQQGRTDLKGLYQINIRNLNRAFIAVTTVGYKKIVVPYQQKDITIPMAPSTVGLHDVTIRVVADR